VLGLPVAIGGVGGSGTRVGAALLGLLGYYIGDDLNDALDNLWFTLLFKRRSVVSDTESDFRDLAAMFFARMSGALVLSAKQRERIWQLCDDERQQHPREWLVGRAESFIAGDHEPIEGVPWGWKEPNTHVVIERLFAIKSDLRYIHFVRHPLDMALSENQNQLQTWGSLLLKRDVRVDARHSLAYWCEAHRRAMTFMSRWPERTLLVDFDALCQAPAAAAEAVAALLGLSAPDAVLSGIVELVQPPGSRGRYRAADLAQFDPADLQYVAALGYDIRT
jgi:hypothetical protein